MGLHIYNSEVGYALVTLWKLQNTKQERRNGSKFIMLFLDSSAAKNGSKS